MRTKAKKHRAPKLAHFFNPKTYSGKQKFVIVVVAFAVIGATTLLVSKAATFVASMEPEQGTVTGPAVSVSGDSTASGNAYVQFKAASQSGTCPAYPAFPDINCAGWQHTGVQLKTYSGPSNISAPNTTLDGYNLPCLTISAANVTITRSKISCPGGLESDTNYGIYIEQQATSFSLIDSEIMSSTVPSDCQNGDPPLLTRPIYMDASSGAHLQRDYFHNVRTGIGIGNNSTIEDSMLITDCNPDPHNNAQNTWQHSSAIGTSGGSSNVIIRHNFIENGGANASGAIQLYPQNFAGGPNDNITITQNHVDALAHFCAYLGYTPVPDGESPNTRLTITNNVWGTKYNPECGDEGAVFYYNFNLTSFNTPYPQGWGGTWSGNTWKNGQPYNLSDLSL